MNSGTGAAAFAGGTVLVLVVLGVISFVVALALEVFGENEPQTISANAFSYSAIGHRGLFTLLEAGDRPVRINRYEQRFTDLGDDLLLVLEPNPSLFLALLRWRLTEARHPVLVVLPKWRGIRSKTEPRWAGEVAPIDPEIVMAVLQAVLPGAELVRNASPGAWSVNAFANPPSLARPQLFRSTDAVPLIANAEGILLAEVLGGEHPVWLLSDPDILANHGLGDGANAALIMAVIDRLLPAGSAVVFDETAHGYLLQPNLWRQMFRPPFLASTLLAIASVLVLLWGFGGRFGAPLNPPPAMRPGKAGLIANTATLLTRGRHDRALLDRYIELVINGVARQLHIPGHAGESETLAWLDRIAKARDITPPPSALVARARRIAGGATERSRMIRIARDLNRWKQDMLHGTGSR